MIIETLLFATGLSIGGMLFWWQRGLAQGSAKEQQRLQQSTQVLQQQLELEQAERLALVQQLSCLKTQNSHLLAQVNDGQAKAKDLQEKLLLQFKVVSDELLTKKSEQFSKQNQQQIDLLLRPLREKITDFQKQVSHSHQASQERTVVLKEAFDKVNTLYEKMRQDTAKTTRAIMGDNKLQGTWGEVHALHLLERTGLKKNEQYFVQKSFSTTDGKRYIPDFVIKLPGDRTIIMDVKVSLVDYVKFFNATNEKERTTYLKKHIQSIKRHIHTLAAKNYAQMYQLHGLDFVLLLLPLEPAFALAVQQEPSLFEEAYTQNIVLVSPTTLQATLSMIDHIWKDTARNRYALEIAQQSGALYDKFVGFVENLSKISHQLTLTQKSCDEAMKKLADGRGNLINRVEKLKKLGARTSKHLRLPNGESISIEGEQ